MPCLQDISISNDIHGGKVGAEDVEHGGRSCAKFVRNSKNSKCLTDDKRVEFKLRNYDQGGQGGDRGKHGIIKRGDRNVARGGNVSHESITMPLILSYQLEMVPYLYLYRYHQCYHMCLNLKMIIINHMIYM